MSNATSIRAAIRPLAGYFSRVGYVTGNLDATAQSFGRLVGISRFNSRELSLSYARRQSDADVRVKLGAGAIGPQGEFEVELIEPIHGESILHRFLEKSGAGIHHIGFAVPDFEAFTEPLFAQGASLMEYDAVERRGAFFRCPPLGAIIEIAEESGHRRPAPRAVEGEGANVLAAHFMQVAYIVRDLEAAHQWLHSNLGIDSFETGAMVQGPGLNLKVRGNPVAYDFHLKRSVGHLGPAGQVEIELLEPELGNNPLGEFLETHGPGLHHIAFKVPDYDAATAALRATATPPLKEISRGRIHSSYFDCTREGLSYVEVFQVD
ncbi:MAG: VOC family protein [Candidatus Binataceae bacterium]